MGAAETARRTDELIEAFDLGAFADRTARSYSGGQRRRLEVALGIMHHPQVLFLDEPTTGLDPQNRANLWDQLRELRSTGTTVFLTTHYLDEADQLSDRLAIIDHGRVIAEGTPAGLKQRYSGDMIDITPSLPPASLPSLEHDLASGPFVRAARTSGDSIRLSVTDATRAMAGVFGLLRQPVWIVTGLSAPLLYLAPFERLLRSVAGGAGLPPGEVLDVFVPGILALMAFGAGMGAGWVVIWEMDSGVIERLRVTPASRFALLLGTVLRDVVMFAVPAVVVIAIAIGFGFHARWGGLALMLFLLAALTTSCSASSSALGISLKQIGSLAAVVTGVQLPPGRLAPRPSESGSS